MTAAAARSDTPRSSSTWLVATVCVCFFFFCYLCLEIFVTSSTWLVTTVLFCYLCLEIFVSILRNDEIMKDENILHVCHFDRMLVSFIKNESKMTLFQKRTFVFSGYLGL